ncbi:MAG: hypothetical protein ACHQJ5_06345 [Vicinamibacteria bacterium]|jgi:hypothetical protein
MAQPHSKQSQSGSRSRATKTVNPADVARRELIEWCKAHQLPVPDERRSQSSGR